nr:hypothetical protein [Mycoplasmopsis bovis]
MIMKSSTKALKRMGITEEVIKKQLQWSKRSSNIPFRPQKE